MWLLVFAASAHAADVKVAVASSFLDTMVAIADEVQRSTGHRLLLNDGSTGELYAQIINDAPFEVYLAGDDIDPKNLEDDGFAVPGSRFTYAVGRLTLWSQNPTFIGSDGLAILRAQKFKHLAISNAKTSSYGHAAVQVLKAWELWEALEERVLEADDSRQAFQLVESGKAELGLVPLGEVLDPDLKNKGSRWDVPVTMYGPIRHDAVLLIRGQSSTAARELMQFLKDRKAHEIMRRFGFDMP
jgi:molybdate transport system substrate-binding protein